MATRSRTTLFLQYRQSFSRTTRRKPNQTLVLNNVLGANIGDEKAGLLDNDKRKINYNSDVVIEMGSISPKWTELVGEIDGLLSKMKEKMGQLEQLHKKHLLPGFEENYSDERQIDVLSDDIAKLMGNAQRKIKQFESKILQAVQATAAANAPPLPIDNEMQPVPTEPVTLNETQQKLVKNIQISLAQKLHEIGTQFRKQQNLYLQKLKGRETQASGFMASQSIGSTPDATNTNDFIGGGSSLSRPNAAVSFEIEDYDIDTGFTSQQNSIVTSNEAIIAEREKAITNIAKSINQIATIFQELNTMIIDQGTILDRIDYNMEMAVTSLKEGVVELKKGEEYQKASRLKYIVFILLMLVFVCAVLLIYKRSSNSRS